MLLRGICIAAIASVACAAGLSPSAATIKEIVANRDAYVGQRISPTGRLHVEFLQSLEPCEQNDPRCGWPAGATLHLVEPGEPRSATNSIDVYRTNADGTYAPWPCRIVGRTDADCAPFTSGDVTTVQGVFIKERRPTQTVGSSGGGSPQALQYQDVYFLAVSR